MEMECIAEFVPLEKDKIDPKLEKLRKDLVGASAIKRDLFGVERKFDASVANDAAITFKNYFYIDGDPGEAVDVSGVGVGGTVGDDVNGAIGEDSRVLSCACGCKNMSEQIAKLIAKVDTIDAHVMTLMSKRISHSC